MTISYEWRGQFTSAEANSLHAECFEHRVLSDGEWDWRGQVERHSLGGGCARGGAGLGGVVNVAWDGVHPDQRRADPTVAGGTMARFVELRRHTDNDGDVLSAGGGGGARRGGGGGAGGD